MTFKVLLFQFFYDTKKELILFFIKSPHSSKNFIKITSEYALQ